MFPRSILRTGLALFPLLAAAQTTVPAEDRAGVPLDWSHLHVIFSQPATEDQFRQLDADPRYSLQTLRRTHPQFAEAAAGFPAATAATAAADPGRDWSEAIGTSPYTLSSPTYPAKYSFNVNNPTPSCTNPQTTTPIKGQIPQLQTSSVLRHNKIIPSKVVRHRIVHPPGAATPETGFAATKICLPANRSAPYRAILRSVASRPSNSRYCGKGCNISPASHLSSNNAC